MGYYGLFEDLCVFNAWGLELKYNSYKDKKFNYDSITFATYDIYNCIQKNTKFNLKEHKKKTNIYTVNLSMKVYKPMWQIKIK